jgi:hypothetical protein
MVEQEIEGDKQEIAELTEIRRQNLAFTRGFLGCARVAAADVRRRIVSRVHFRLRTSAATAGKFTWQILFWEY